jgi:hypothetical protein
MATTSIERDEIRLLAEEIRDMYLGSFDTVDHAVETVLRRRLIPAAAYSLPLGELRLKDKKGEKS